jgi:hypothetical protein
MKTFHAQDIDKAIKTFKSEVDLNEYLLNHPDSKSVSLLFYAKNETGYWMFESEFDRQLFLKQYPDASTANAVTAWKAQKYVWLLSSTCGILNSQTKMIRIEGKPQRVSYNT